jgi:RNA polymerase sigma-70 factor (ECF subfamily)
VARRVLANQRRGRERQARLGLGEADRELLRLVAWEGLGHEQIAAVLGCTRATARVRLHRARKRFAARLAEARMAIDTAPAPAAWAGARHDRREAL